MEFDGMEFDPTTLHQQTHHTHTQTHRITHNTHKTTHYSSKSSKSSNRTSSTKASINYDLTLNTLISDYNSALQSLLTHQSTGVSSLLSILHDPVFLSLHPHLPVPPPSCPSSPTPYPPRGPLPILPSTCPSHVSRKLSSLLKQTLLNLARHTEGPDALKYLALARDVAAWTTDAELRKVAMNNLGGGEVKVGEELEVEEEVMAVLKTGANVLRREKVTKGIWESWWKNGCGGGAVRTRQIKYEPEGASSDDMEVAGSEQRDKPEERKREFNVGEYKYSAYISGIVVSSKTHTRLHQDIINVNVNAITTLNMKGEGGEMEKYAKIEKRGGTQKKLTRSRTY